MPLARLIPCLDVAGGRVVKGVRFGNLRDVGDPVELGASYSDAGADELVYLDIRATLDGRAARVRLVERVAERLAIPFTVGGGVRSAEDDAFSGVQFHPEKSAAAGARYLERCLSRA